MQKRFTTGEARTLIPVNGEPAWLQGEYFLESTTGERMRVVVIACDVAATYPEITVVRTVRLPAVNHYPEPLAFHTGNVLLEEIAEFRDWGPDEPRIRALMDMVRAYPEISKETRLRAHGGPPAHTLKNYSRRKSGR